MKKDKKQESLGFIFGYKDGSQSKNENNQNVIRISFKSGISKKFPSKYENFKDFWAQEIFVGQTSDIYVNLDYFKEAFNQELKEITDNLKSEHSYYKEVFEQRKYYFDYDINAEQLAGLTSFSMAHMHIPYQKWENEQVFEQALKECIGDLFKKENRTILEIYNNYKDVSEYIYNKETADALGEPIVNASKPKM